MISARLAQMFADATNGMTYMQVCERAGIDRSTWANIKRGWVPPDETLLRVVDGLGLDPEPFLVEAHTYQPVRDPVETLKAVLRLSPLSQPSQFQLLQLYRTLAAQDSERADEAA